MITFSVSGELEMFQETARDFARSEVRPKNREAEEAGAAPPELGAKYLSLGLGAIELPERVGGLGQGLVARVIVEEEIAHGDLGLALAMPSTGAFGQALMLLGTEAQQAEWLPRLIESGRRGVILWSEPKPKLGSFATAAIEEADGRWRITGQKAECVLADEAALAVVFAEARHLSGEVGPAAFVLDLPAEPRPADGVRFGPRADGLGLNAAPAVEVALESVRVPAGARLTGAGARFESAVVELFLRIALVGAARAVGTARAAFEYARGYAAERQAFGKAIAHFQSIAFLAADMATRVEVMRGLVHRAAWAFDTGDADASKWAAMAAAEAHEGAMFVTNNAVQILGGAGFIQDYPVEKWMRDAKAHMAYAMPHHLCDLLVGRQALEGGPLMLNEDAPMPGVQPVLV